MFYCSLFILTIDSDDSNCYGDLDIQTKFSHSNITNGGWLYFEIAPNESGRYFIVQVVKTLFIDINDLKRGMMIFYIMLSSKKYYIDIESK